MSTYTYNEDLPGDRDKARAALGDTDMDAMLLSDEHVDAVLAIQSSLKAAVTFLADELLARFASQPVRMVDANGETVDYSGRLAAWQRIADAARAAATTTGGGLSFVPATYTGETTADEFARPPDYWP